MISALWRRRLLRAAGLGLLALALYAASGARFVRPAPTLLLTDRHGEFLGEVAQPNEERGFWPVEALPERVVAATLALEDRRFWGHPGVDVLAIGRAVGQNLSRRTRVSGASTLAMQVARLQRPGGRGYLRKAAEALTAVFLTARYGREGILRQYLTLVPYGNRIHGIGYAARRYLDKPVADLSWAEIAFLAAIPQSPARRNPFEPLGRLRAIERGKRILAALEAQGVLSAEERAIALHEIDRLRVPGRGIRSAEAMHNVLAWAARYGDPAARRAYRGPLVLRTALDLELQRTVARRTWGTIREWERFGAGNAAVLVVEQGSWAVRAAVSSTDYFDTEHAGAIDYLRVPRLSGSTLKPFLYAQALETGQIHPTTILDDLEPAVGGVTNADERYLGPLLPRFALANSRNVPAVNLLADLGVEAGAELFARLRLHDRSAPAGRFGVGLAVGGLPVTLEQLVTAYTTLAGEGRLEALRWTEGPASEPGQASPGPRRDPEERAPRIFREETARQLALFLADPQARLPSFPRMGASEYPFPVAVKTGTSSQFRDAWAIAWSKRYLVGVWVGHPDYKPMAELSGFKAAARIAQETLLPLHADELQGLSDLAFPPPRGYRPVRVCALSGGLATAACDRVLVEYLRPEQLDPDPCRWHRHEEVDRRTGRRAEPGTPKRHRQPRVFVALPARYAGWALRQALPQAAREDRPGTPSAPGAPTSLVSLGPVRLTITAPREGERFLLDPEAPPGRSTLALRLQASAGVEQITWYIDGQPFATVGPPFTVRWPLKPGEHRIEARMPYGNAYAGPVRVRVE